MTTQIADERLESMLEWVRSHHFGKYRGQVTDNADPTGRGRVKVRIPSVLGDNDVWAMPCVPYAGAGVGFYCMPEPGTNVWVEFEAGDSSFPVWTGCFWGDGELPDDSNPDRVGPRKSEWGARTASSFRRASPGTTPARSRAGFPALPPPQTVTRLRRSRPRRMRCAVPSEGRSQRRM